MIRRFLVIGLLATSSGCVTLRSMSVTPIPLSGGKTVEASAETGLLFLSISGNTEFVDNLIKDLRGQCEGGTVTGILTKFETKSWPFFAKHTVTASGDCNL